MQEQLSALYELQAMDLRIAQIEAALAAPSGARETRAKLAETKAQLEVAEKTLSQQEGELKDSELELKSIEEKRSNYEKRLYDGSVTNRKELGAMEKEVAILKEQQAKLDTRTLALYDQVQTARTQVETLSKQAEELTTQGRRMISQESAARTQLETELAELRSRREESAPRVTDKTLLARYSAVRRKAGGMGIARVIDGKCEACRISLMPFMLRELAHPKEMRTCESCGRILFVDGK